MIQFKIYKSNEPIDEKEFNPEEKPNITIGRNEDNDIILPVTTDEDQVISRLHCVLEYSDGVWNIINRGSQIYTQLNDIDLIDKGVLKNNDTIRIGNYTFHVTLPELTKEIPAEKILAKNKPKYSRVKTPTLIQMEAVECGAAALGIVLGYYGRHIPLEQLRIDCGVTRDGSKASNILKAARRHGLIAKGYKYDLKNLLDLEFPIIIFWNFNHFLVLEGFRRKKVYLNDPARGPRVVSPEELDISFSGVVLTFSPKTDPSQDSEEIPIFEKKAAKTSMFDALRSRLSGSEKALAYVFLCGLLLVIPGLIIPIFSRVFIDEFLLSQKKSIIQPLIIGMGFTAIIRMFLTWLQQHYLLRLETKLTLVTSSRFFYHVLRLPVTYFNQRSHGEIGSRVMINDKVANIISERLTTTLLDALMIVFYGLLMLWYSVRLTTVCIALAMINILAMRIIARKRVDASQRNRQDMGKLAGISQRGIQMMETLKGTGSEDDFFSRWSGYQAKVLKGEQDLSFWGNIANVFPPFVNSLITLTILAYGGLLIMEGFFTVGMLVAYQNLMASFTKPLENLVKFGGEIQELKADMNRLDDVERYPKDERYTITIKAADSIRNKTKLSGYLELRNVSFGYNPLEKPLIDNFNLIVNPGERVALVGGSGSGKSTVARLITGLLKAWSGEILFDGVPREEIPPNLINSSMGIVDQEIFLFSGTIRENLSMWDVRVPDENIISATRDAAIDEVIQTRPSSYASIVDEDGVNFSGGQRQRLEIARSLVCFPSLLILDEATSALDPTTEKIISDNLRRRLCSCVIVAHRLSTIRDCDEIIVMERGNIKERGTHEELNELDGLYAKLIKE